MTSSSNFCLDASALITPWDITYPMDMFPEVWKGDLAGNKDRLVFIKDIFDEINLIPPADKKALEEGTLTPGLQKKHSLRMWLENGDFSVVEIENKKDSDVINAARFLRQSYRTELYSKGGAGINDIKLIAYAKIHGHTVVTLETLQDPPPSERKNYKIPLICDEEGVECIDFITLIRRLRGLPT